MHKGGIEGTSIPITSYAIGLLCSGLWYSITRLNKRYGNNLANRYQSVVSKAMLN